MLGYDPTDAEAFQLFIEYTKLADSSPLVVDGTFPLHARGTRARWSRSSCAAAKKIIFKAHEGELLPHLPKPIHVPKDHTFMNRLQWGLASVMAGIGGEGNYRRIAEPWIRGPLKPTE